MRAEPLLTTECRPLIELHDIVAQWQALAERAIEPNAFYEPAFALAAAPIYGPDARALLVWREGADKKLVGFFPVRVARRFGVGPRLLTGWLHPFAMLGTPLVDRDTPELVIAACMDRIEHDRDLPNVALLPTLPVHGVFASALDRVLDDRAAAHVDFGLHRRALLVATSDDPEYHLSRLLGARHRKELPRRRRRLQELGPVAHEVARTEPEIRRALEVFVALEASGWKGERGTAAATCPKRLHFFRQAITGLSRSGKVRIDLLRVADDVIAVSLALRSGNAAFGWKMAYDESYAKYSPGAQLMLDLTRDLLTDPEIERVDSCAASGHPMIDHLWRDRLAVADRMLAVGGRAAAGFGLVCAAETVRRQAIQGLKQVRRQLSG